MWFDGLGFDRGSPLFAIGQPRPVYGMNEAKVYLLGSANRHTSYEEPEERDGVRHWGCYRCSGLAKVRQLEYTRSDLFPLARDSINIAKLRQFTRSESLPADDQRLRRVQRSIIETL
jgi:hypothetical protein